MKLLPIFADGIAARDEPRELARSKDSLSMRSGVLGRSVSEGTRVLMDTTENLLDDLCMGIERELMSLDGGSISDDSLYGNALEDCNVNRKKNPVWDYDGRNDVDDETLTFFDSVDVSRPGSKITDKLSAGSANEIEIDLIEVPFFNVDDANFTGVKKIHRQSQSSEKQMELKDEDNSLFTGASATSATGISTGSTVEPMIFIQSHIFDDELMRIRSESSRQVNISVITDANASSANVTTSGSGSIAEPTKAEGTGEIDVSRTSGAKTTSTSVGSFLEPIVWKKTEVSDNELSKIKTKDGKEVDKHDVSVKSNTSATRAVAENSSSKKVDVSETRVESEKWAETKAAVTTESVEITAAELMATLDANRSTEEKEFGSSEHISSGVTIHDKNHQEISMLKQLKRSFSLARSQYRKNRKIKFSGLLTARNDNTNEVVIQTVAAKERSRKAIERVLKSRHAAYLWSLSEMEENRMTDEHIVRSTSNPEMKKNPMLSCCVGEDAATVPSLAPAVTSHNADKTTSYVAMNLDIEIVVPSDEGYDHSMIDDKIVTFDVRKPTRERGAGMWLERVKCVSRSIRMKGSKKKIL